MVNKERERNLLSRAIQSDIVCKKEHASENFKDLGCDILLDENQDRVMKLSFRVHNDY